MINFPKMTTEYILDRLKSRPGKINMVLDTDTYNEVDDQFALVYALRSDSRLNVEAVYAAPFKNERAGSPGEGMEKSYDEIHRILGLMDYKIPDNFVFKGSTRYLEHFDTPCESDAARDLIKRAMSADEPLYVVAIGAITNIASAILIEPGIIEKIVVVWLGGHALHWHDTKEFNLMQDVLAARVVLDCGVPFVQVPCANVVDHLSISAEELKRHIENKNPIGGYLTGIVREFCSDYNLMTKVIWDISAIAYLINPEWVPTFVVHSPVVTDQVTWSTDSRRHFIKTAYHVDRDAIFKDLFEKI